MNLEIPKNGLYISATGGKGKSYSDPQLQHGIFTYYLAKAMLEGDKNKDGTIETSELKPYLEKVKERAQSLGYTDQNPTLLGNLKEVIEK